MNKFILGFVLGVASVLILGMVSQSASAGFLDRFFASPPKQTVSDGSDSVIRAHSCDADESCEINDAQVNGKMTSRSVETQSMQVGTRPNVFDNMINAASLVINPRSFRIHLGEPYDQDSAAPFYIRFYYEDRPNHAVVKDVLKVTGDPGQDTDKLTITTRTLFEDSVTIDRLSNAYNESIPEDGRAYACLDANGKLFRNPEPCL